MPRPKAMKSQIKEKKPMATKLVCASCGVTRPSKDFPTSYSVYHNGTGRVQFCTECIIKMSCNESEDIDIEKFKKVLEKIDKPFLATYLQVSYGESKKTMDENGKCTHPIRFYFKNINSLSQNKHLTWKDSVFANIKSESVGAINNYKLAEQEEYPQEVLKRWRGHDISDIAELEEFYQTMYADNRIETVQDRDYLCTLSKIKLQRDKAFLDGDFSSFKQLSELFSKYMTDAKLRAQDRTDADRSGGIKNFSLLYLEAEKEGFIPPWESRQKIIGCNQDIVDRTIMHILNFTLKLVQHEKLLSPPLDTPKCQNYEIDPEAKYYNDVSSISSFSNDSEGDSDAN